MLSTMRRETETIVSPAMSGEDHLQQSKMTISPQRLVSTMRPFDSESEQFTKSSNDKLIQWLHRQYDNTHLEDHKI